MGEIVFNMRYWFILVLVYAFKAIAVPSDQVLDTHSVTHDDDTLVDQSDCNPWKAEKCLKV